MLAYPQTRRSSEQAEADDAAFMRRALELAQRGEALVSPNPMVGAVVVRGGEVVGEGSYTYEGVRHAEVAALEQAGANARGATLYVNLEPCCHYGRTPPCAEAVIEAGVARVAAGTRDPNPRVSGGGFARLRAAGIDVREGVLEEECRRLNEQFIRHITGGVFMTLKGAMTLDGCIAAPGQQATDRRITGREAHEYVQILRHRHDALVTGAGTALADDPLLTDRSGLPRRRPLLRVVMDSALRLSPDSRLAQSARRDLLVVCVSEASRGRQQALEARGVEVFRMADSGRTSWPPLLAELRRREITSVLLEAGSALNASALESGLVDKIVLVYAPKLLGGQDAVPLFGGRGFRTLSQARPVRVTDLRRVGEDFVVEGYLREV